MYNAMRNAKCMMQFQNSHKKSMQVSHERGSDAFVSHKNDAIQDTRRMMQLRYMQDAIPSHKMIQANEANT